MIQKQKLREITAKCEQCSSIAKLKCVLKHFKFHPKPSIKWCFKTIYHIPHIRSANGRHEHVQPHLGLLLNIHDREIIVLSPLTRLCGTWCDLVSCCGCIQGIYRHYHCSHADKTPLCYCDEHITQDYRVLTHTWKKWLSNCVFVMWRVKLVSHSN